MTNEWQPIETAPKDGQHFLVWATCLMDEEDEEGNVIRKVKHQYAMIAYHIGAPFNATVEFPFRNSFPSNQWFTHWMPLPKPPNSRGKRRGSAPGSISTTPANPDLVRRIVVLRDVHKMTFDQISEALSDDKPITKMGVWLVYDKWKEWAHAEGM